MTRKLNNVARIAVFPGSFDPFTVGHASIVERGLKLFDHIIIGIGYNEHKSSLHSIEKRIECIRKLYSTESRVSVEAYTGLTVNFAMQNEAKFILRGIRGVADMEYERNIADTNRVLSGIETVFMLSLPEHSFISSSMIRELQNNGADIENFVPHPQLKDLNLL